MVSCCGDQHPEVAVAKVVDVGQRSAVRSGALPTAVPRPLTTSHVELGEHPSVVLGSVEPLGNRTGDIEVVAAGDVPDRQLLDKTFQRGGFPLVLRWFVIHSCDPSRCCGISLVMGQASGMLLKRAGAAAIAAENLSPRLASCMFIVRSRLVEEVAAVTAAARFRTPLKLNRMSRSHVMLSNTGLPPNDIVY